MKIIDCEQGTDGWRKARLGIPTASEFHRIITPAKGDLSKQARGYAHQLVAEIILGRPVEKPGATFAMQRGKDLEPFAIQQYAFTRDVDVRTVGFVTTDDGRAGCSPDGLIITQRSGLEVKCTLDATHMGLFIDGPGDDYKPQVQACLAICELDAWDLYAYHPEMPPVTIRTQRDEPYITKMRAALAEFFDMRDAMLMKARASGFFANDNQRKAA